MAQRTCRACGKSFEHPAPGAYSTKRFCGDCMQLPEAVRDVLARHQTELTRLRRELDKLKSGPVAEATADES